MEILACEFLFSKLPLHETRAGLCAEDVEHNL